MEDQLIRELEGLVKEKTRAVMEKASLGEVASLDWLQGLLLVVVKAVFRGIVGAWKEVLFEMAREMLRACPGCGWNRKWSWRRSRTVKLSVVGLDFELDSPLVDCCHCDSPAVNVVKLLTGLRSGDASTELKLLAGYEGALETYGRASHDLRVHHGQEVERTKVRRLGLDVETEAMAFREEQRRSADQAELPAAGADCLLIEADGGSVRTGVLVPCEEGDEGYGQTTPSRGIARRKKLIQKREILTMDVRAPGEAAPRALEALVPVLSGKGERGRRMRTMAARAGRGAQTDMRGLGDMGSGLGRAFDDTFGKPHFWSGDWKHVTDYFDAAATVLVDFDAKKWKEEMVDYTWNRHKSVVDHLLVEAFRHRQQPLPEDLEKCPVNSLHTYLNNNWDSLRSKQMREEGLPYRA